MATRQLTRDCVIAQKLNHGGAVEQLTKGQRAHTGITFNKASTKIVYTVGVFEKPSEVCFANVDGTGEKPLPTCTMRSRVNWA